MASDKDPVAEARICFGEFCLDLNARRLYCRSEAVMLRPKSFNTLAYLIENRHRVVSKDELLEKVWGERRELGTVEQATLHLRKALGDSAANPRFIETVVGHGYRFIGKIEVPTQATNNEPPRLASRFGWLRPYRLVWLYALVTVALAVGIASLAVTRREPLPSRAQVSGASLQILDDRGSVMWSRIFLRRPFPEGALSRVERFVRILDLKKDGGREILMVDSKGGIPGSESDAVTCFSRRGSLLWSYRPKNEMQFGNFMLGPPWLVGDLFVSERGKKPIIWVSMMHAKWGNSFVVRLDPLTGAPTLVFVNTGTIRTLAELNTPQGHFLLAGGFNNEYDGGTLAVIDEDGGPAVSPQTERTRHFCRSCKGVGPDFLVVFPRSELNKLGGERTYEQAVITLEADSSEITAGLRELEEFSMARVFYTLNPKRGFDAIAMRFDTGYDLRHRELENTGTLHHSLSDCPERRKPSPVRIWTLASGWRRSTVAAFGPMQ